MKKLKYPSGFTLIELAFVITLVGMVTLTVAITLAPMLNSWTVDRPRLEATASINYAVDRIASELAQLKDPLSVMAATTTSFQFVDGSNSNISYTLSGTNLMRNANVLARNVQQLSFSYWDINNQTLAVPTVAPATTNIWRVLVKVTGLSAGQTLKMEAEIHPRNLPRT